MAAQVVPVASASNTSPFMMGDAHARILTQEPQQQPPAYHWHQSIGLTAFDQGSLTGDLCMSQQQPDAGPAHAGKCAASAMGAQGQRSGPDSQALTNACHAMSRVVLTDRMVAEDSCSRPGGENILLPQAMSQDMGPVLQRPSDMTQQTQLTQQTQQTQPSQGPSTFMPGLARRLQLDMCQTQSQELPLCTPDFNTPGEPQQFMLDYDQAIEEGCEEVSRSPAPSPRRHIKRPRQGDEMSETVSQLSQDPSRSQGDPSTCSKAGQGGKPPMHPNRSARSKLEPPVVRNPYLEPGCDDKHLYHTHQSSMSHKQHRMFWDFKQEERLGGGNFSDVHCIIHRMSGKRYALKKSRKPVSSISEKNMWLAEVQALAAVEGHPNVVTFYDAWVEPAPGTGEWFFIQLELCGPSLAQLLGGQRPGVCAGRALGVSRPIRQPAKEPMRETELLEVLKQMAAALKHIHDLGLAHLDFKPDNIYRNRPQILPALQRSPLAAKQAADQHLSQAGSQAAAAVVAAAPVIYKLGDFGLATAKNAPAPVTEGDARYLAPELLSGRSDVGLDRADMFALGATLYELATGASLPTGGERYHALRNGQLMMMPCVSMKLQQLIKKLMSADPRDRPTADQLLKSSLLAGPSKHNAATPHKHDMNAHCGSQHA